MKIQKGFIKGLNYIKSFFYMWAYIDLKGKRSSKDCFFVKNRNGIAKTNLDILRALSAFFAFQSTFIMLLCLAVYRDEPYMAKIYLASAIFEVAVAIAANRMLKSKRYPATLNFCICLYLVVLLATSVYIGGVLAGDVPTVVFPITLFLAQIIFILPPIYTTCIAATATIVMNLVSSAYKSEYFAGVDFVNSEAALVLSIFVGWYFTMTRIKEAYARAEIEDLNVRLHSLSLRDSLTGLLNRRSFQLVYDEMFGVCRNMGIPLCVVMMDIDSFKMYNDNYGHVEGDRCLKMIGTLLLGVQCDNITAYRFGGEEFIVLMRGASAENGVAFVEALCQKVRELGIVHEYSRAAKVVTLSAGVFSSGIGPLDCPSDFIDKADKAMYLSKAHGGNIVTDYASSYLNSGP